MSFKSSLFQETEIVMEDQCCRCAQELRCGLVRVAQTMTSPVYWATTTPCCGKSHIITFHLVCVIYIYI